MIDILNRLLSGHPMTSAAAEQAMEMILSEDIRPEQIAAFFTSLRFQPLTGELLSGLVRTLQQKSVPVGLDPGLRDRAVDVCGTGGDGSGSFNISTAVAFVVAGGGVPVAKHGNRAVSSRSGSFDVLEAMGISFSLDADSAIEELNSHGLAFLYAPAFHPAFRKLAEVRRALGIRTVMNALGPLLNPAGVRRQVIGVYERGLLRPMAEALQALGAEETLIVHGKDGVDEISLCAPTWAVRLSKGNLIETEIDPRAFGLRMCDTRDLAGGSAVENGRIIEAILSGEMGPRRDVVLINAAAAFWVSGLANDLSSGLALARESIDGGKAQGLLMRLRERSKQV